MVVAYLPQEPHEFSFVVGHRGGGVQDQDTL